MAPGGEMVALIVTDGEDRTIVVRNLATDAVVLRAFTGKAKVRSVRWAGDGHLVFVVTVTSSGPPDLTTTQREWAMAFTMDVKTRKAAPLLKNVGNAMNTIYGNPVVRNYRGEPTVFVQGVTFVNNQGRISLFRVDLDRNTTEVVEIGGPDTRDWVVGPDGEPFAQELYNDKTGQWAIRLKSRSGRPEAVRATALLDPPSMMGLAGDGKSVLYASRDDKGRPVWASVQLDASVSAPSMAAPGNASPIYDPQDGRLIGQFALVGDAGDYNFFDPADAKVWRSVSAAFVGSRVQLRSWSADRRKIIVRVDSPTEGPAFAVVDIASRKATWLGQEYVGVNLEDVSPQSPIAFKARDGMALSGYLTTPLGKAAKALPLIVFPHGGPAARDEPGFDWWAQGMASRGYAVLQVNFRGSDGFGDAHLEAGYGQWGRKMQTDLSDGVAHLAGLGVIDPGRVCIVGASYGGYAALAGATLDTGVYRCAASYGGVSDLKRMVAWSREKKGRSAFRYWTRFMGSKDGQDETLVKLSPAALADRVTIPVLLVHGRDDSVVPLEQSRVMAEALQKAGKPVELLVLKGEDHWLSRGETRLQTLTATMAFVEKHNPPN